MTADLTRKVRHLVGKAINEWGMISHGDRILLGVSGGRDSLALLHSLFSLKDRAPVRFDILPVYIDPGFDHSFASELKRFVDSRFGPCRIEHTDYGPVAHSAVNRKNPCFLCARLRRKRLFEIARDEGCDKVALAHNKDDIIETFFINIFYSGKTGTMKPFQRFFGGAVNVIRPLAYVEKEDIIAFCEKAGLSEFTNQCPSASGTRRNRVRQMLEDMYRENRHIKGNIFRAMGNVATDYLLMQDS